MSQKVIFTPHFNAKMPYKSPSTRHCRIRMYNQAARKTAAFGARRLVPIGRNRHHLFILYDLLMDKESVIPDICFIVIFYGLGYKSTLNTRAHFS